MVSVVIPAYNAGRFLAETIRSVQAQTFSNWELIVVDDGSTDDTASVVKAFLHDGRIKYHYQSNAGVSAARNTGINLSKGAYMAFLDSDDVWLPENLALKVALLDAEPDTGWVFSDMLEMDEAGQITGQAPPGTDKEILRSILLWEREVVPGPGSNLMVRRACLEAGIRFDPQLSTAADQDFCLQLAAKWTGRHIPQATWCYRQLAGSMSRNIRVMERDHMRVYRKAHANGLFESAAFRRRCFSNLYLVLAGSWWKDGGNKLRGLYFIARALLVYPANMTNLFRKLMH